MAELDPSRVIVSLGYGGAVTPYGDRESMLHALFDGPHSESAQAARAFERDVYLGSSPAPVRGGVRELVVGSRLPVNFGGVPLHGLDQGATLRARMGLDPAQLIGTVYEGQRGTLEHVANATVYALWAAAEAMASGFGASFQELGYQPRDIGSFHGSNTGGNDMTASIIAVAQGGQPGVVQQIQASMRQAPGALILNFLLPQISNQRSYTNSLAALKASFPSGYTHEGIPVELAAFLQTRQDQEAWRFGSPNETVDGACASYLYALERAFHYLTGQNQQGVAIVTASDDVFTPRESMGVVPGLGEIAIITRQNILMQMIMRGELAGYRLQGNKRDITIVRDDGSPVSWLELWNSLPFEEREKALNKAGAPFTELAMGLVPASGGVAMPYANFRDAILRGQWPTSIVTAVSTGFGQGQNVHIEGIDHGFLDVTDRALAASAAMGIVPNVFMAHAAGTRLGNIAEFQYYAALAVQYGIDLLRICANKSLMGHTFAAAGGVDELAAVRAMVSGQTPRVNGYDPAYHDPRISSELQRRVQISRGGPFAVRGTLTTSMGLGGHYAARTAAPFPQEMEAAVATLRQWNFSENDISHFRQQAPANRAAAHARYRALRSGQMKARQVYETSRFVRR